MKLLLRLAFLGLLCFHVQSWVLKSDTQNKHWKELSQPQIRELFLDALHMYISTRGIQVNRTAPPFVLTSRDQDTGTHGTQEEQDTMMHD